MKGLELPPIISAALSGIRWPLGTEAPPLHFRSLDDMKQIRSGSSSNLELFHDVPAALESLFPLRDTDKEVRHFGSVSIALILLGHGLTDECHDLVTPLSWPDDIHFAHGPSVYDQASPSARAYASYVHALVHRKEAFHRGEFGMIGFQNANYWSSASNSSPGADSLPHADLYREITSLAREFVEHEPVQSWCSQHLVVPSSIFDARMLHQLCANVQKQTPRDENMQKFTEQAVESETRVLLNHSLRKAGFEFHESLVLEKTRDTCAAPSVSIKSVMLDVNVALSASRKVSSAHLDQFRTQGSVILRSILSSHVNVSNIDALAAAAGIACRLLESPGCRLISDLNECSGQALVEIGFSHTEQTHENSNQSLYLKDGDALVQKKVTRRPYLTNYLFEACAAKSPELTFFDPLYGTRGETPTTVVQWSKGTIF